jgi:hypothetical protein
MPRRCSSYSKSNDSIAVVEDAVLEKVCSHNEVGQSITSNGVVFVATLHMQFNVIAASNHVPFIDPTRSANQVLSRLQLPTGGDISEFAEFLLNSEK